MGIIAGSLALKLPMILNMIKGQTAKGLVFQSMLSELLNLVLNIGYNYHFGYAVSTYGENIIILIQSLVILFLALKYKEISSIQLVQAAALSFTLLGTFLLDYAPDALYTYNQVIVLGLRRFVLNLELWSRVPQILANHKNKFTGVLAHFLRNGGCRLLRKNLHIVS